MKSISSLIHDGFVHFNAALDALFSRKYAFALVLLVVGFLSYGLLIPWLGLYGDDPYFLYSYYRYGAEGFQSVLGWFRPFAVPFYQAIVPIIGFNIWVYHLLLLLLRWLTAVLLWQVLTLIWQKAEVKAQWAALLCLVYPGFLEQAIPMEFILHFAVMSSFLASLYFMLRTARAPTPRARSTIAALLFALPQVMIEYFVGLELVRPVLLWLVGSETANRGERLKRFLRSYAPYFILFLAYAVWRLFILESRYLQPALLRTLVDQPLGGIRIAFDEIVRYFVVGAVTSWGKLFAFPPVSTTLVVYLGVVLAVAALLHLYYRFAWTDERAFANQNREALAMLAGGLLVFLTGGVPFWVAQVPVDLKFPWDRTTLGIFVGVGTMMVGLISYLIKSKRQMGVVILLVALAAGFHFQNANSYRREWEQARTYFWQMAWRMPSLQPGTLVLSDMVPLSTYPDNSISPLVNWMYDPQNHTRDERYHFLNIDARLGGVLPSLEPGAVVAHGGFEGSTAQAVVVYQSATSCLRVLTSQALAANFASEAARGRYMAVYGLVWQIPSVFGPTAAGVILDRYNPNLLWYVGGGLCALAALGFYLLHLRLGRQTRFAPAAKEST